MKNVHRGSCLCESVKFEVRGFTGPFELCHCHRCRKFSGSAFFAGIYAESANLKFLEGQDLIKIYEAPIVRNPPPYRACFCSRCGSPVPDPNSPHQFVEVPAGLLDDGPGLIPDKHIFVEHKAHWFEISGDLPRMTEQDIRRHRTATE